tara:strand:- start:22524 stop:22739 length:216 start_codon:yes stop_codon:yes gene_type:complete
MSNTAPDIPAQEQSQFRVKGEIPIPVLINWLSIAAVPLLAFFAWRLLGRGEARALHGKHWSGNYQRIRICR